MSVANEEQIHSAVSEKREDMVDLLSELIRTKPLTGSEGDAQAVIIDYLKELGLEPDVWEADADNLRDHEAFFETRSFKEVGYSDRPNVAARIPGAGDGPSLALSGHIDVVPVTEEEWSYDPWTPTVEDGRLYGRGSYDMLCGVVSILTAYEVIDELGFELAGELILQTTIEEEEGGIGGVLSALERGYQPDAAIIGESWELPDIGMASGGAMSFDITVPGKSAHAAFPYEGVHAIDKAVKIYNALDDLDQRRKERISYEPAWGKDERMKGNETNLNVGIFEAGNWGSSLAPSATLKGRIGWPPGEEKDEVYEEFMDTIQSVVDADEWLSEHPPDVDMAGWVSEPHELDTNEEIVQTVQHNAELVTGKETTFSGGWSGLDERFYNRYYDIPCPSVGARGGRCHGPDEYVEIDSLVDTSETFARTIIDWCGTVE